MQSADIYQSISNQILEALRKAKASGGGRFQELKESLSKKGVKGPGALAASIGRKKYGANKMAKMAAAVRKRKS